MKIERNKGEARDIEYAIRGLEIAEDACTRYGGNCRECPLSRLGVFETMTCEEIKKMRKRLELILRLVEEL